MSNIKVCRICLRDNLKFYTFDEYFLKSYYEEIMSLPVSEEDGRPYYLCYECAALLHKFHMFRQKCYFSQNALTELIWSGQVNLDTVTKISKNPKLQLLTLDILTVNKRVNTYVMKQPSSEEDGQPLKEEVYIVNYADLSFSDDETETKESEINTTTYSPKIELDFDNFVDNDDTEQEEEKIEEQPKTKAKSKPKKKSPAKSKETTSKARKTPKKRVLRKRKKQPIPEETDSEYEDNSNAVFKDVNDYKFNQAKSGGLKVLKFLDSGFWKKSMLTEEEATKEFHAKAQDRKYLRAAYKCTDCYRGFSKKNMLDRHIPLRHGESIGSLVCRFCKTRFKFAYHLNKHMRQHFTRYECLRCNLVCNLDKSALYHEEYHNGVIRKCPHCDQEFKHLSTFYTHLRTHRSKHMCARCGESFVSQRGLYLHKKVKHIDDMESEVVDVDGSIYCDVCKINFETRDAYDIHLLHSAMHTDDKTNDDTLVKDIIREDEENEEKDDDDVAEPSHLYSRKTRVEKTLSAIRKRALTKSSTKCAKKPTTCQHCGKHFETQKACRKHHHAEHPRKPFYTPKDRVICEICGASLAPSSVPAHLNHHTHHKMYTCDTCGKSFTTNNVLRNHMATHTGERNHPCHICGKRFAQSGSLYLHYKTIHLKQPYPKRNRKKKVEEPTTEPAPSIPLNGKDEYRAWKHFFDNSTYTNS